MLLLFKFANRLVMMSFSPCMILYAYWIWIRKCTEYVWTLSSHLISSYTNVFMHWINWLQIFGHESEEDSNTLTLQKHEFIDRLKLAPSQLVCLLHWCMFLQHYYCQSCYIYALFLYCLHIWMHLFIKMLPISYLIEYA